MKRRNCLKYNILYRSSGVIVLSGSFIFLRSISAELNGAFIFLYGTLITSYDCLAVICTTFIILCGASVV